MKKVLLFLFILGVVAVLEPRTRERMLSIFPSLSAATHQRSAERAIKQIALALKNDADETGAFPRPNDFGQWLKDADRPTEDPWGSRFYLELYPDSFVVGSPGPDAKRRSDDDVRLTRFRGPKAAHLRPGYSPPAPPPSGVKSSAIRNAKEAAARNKN